MAIAPGYRSVNPPVAVDISQWIALVVGVAYLTAGVAGWAVTGTDDFAHHDTGERLLGFEINPLHNVVHMVLGLAGVAAWRRLDSTATYGIALAVLYGGAFVYGLLAVDAEWDVLSLNWADNGLHLGTAVLGAVIAALATRRRPVGPLSAEAPSWGAGGRRSHHEKA